MSWYSRWVFPYLCDWALQSAEVSVQRQFLLKSAVGRVLEIGFGTGLNLIHYPNTVVRLTVIDPNPGMHRLARRRLRQMSIPVDACPLDGQNLPFADGTFDTVVSTFTLCSIPDAARAVAEGYRVLSFKGRFLFLEHGLSPDAIVQRWQRRLNRVQMWLADGCHLDRDIAMLIRQQTFADVQVESFYLQRVPRTHGYLFRGIALKA